MPIRFRCAYCNQLLGIARRKVGTVVRCPTCAGQVVVPEQDAEGLDKTDDSGSQPLFERDDFDDLLDLPAKAGAARATEAEARPRAIEPAGAWGTHAEPPFAMDRLNPAATTSPNEKGVVKPAGIVLSPLNATLLTIAFIIVVVLAFLIGLGVDHWLLHAS